MSETRETITFIADPSIKSLLRLRAAKQGISVSKLARETFMQCFPEASEQERVFLASNGQNYETRFHGSEQ